MAMLGGAIFLTLFKLLESHEILRDQTDIKVKSPGYPDIYPAHSNQTWRFKQQHGIWFVKVEQFRLQLSDDCAKDYLEITEMSKSYAKKHCGVKTGSLYTSSGPEIVLKFVSDGIEQHEGFHLEVYHFDKKEDVESGLADIHTKRNAAKASVYKANEAKLVESVVFYSLLGLFGFCALALFALVTYYIHHNRSRQSRTTDKKQYHQNIAYHGPIVIQQAPRRYSKSRENAANRLPTRYV